MSMYLLLVSTMPWNIAQAKQQFSEVVRLSAQEPQAIYNRETAVAAVIGAAEYDQFQKWRQSMQQPSLEQQFDELRDALAQAGLHELDLPPRQSIERRNAFADAVQRRKKAK